MADEASRGNFGNALAERFLGRLRGRRSLLVFIAAVFAGLAVFAVLTALQAGLAFAVVALAAVLLPHSVADTGSGSGPAVAAAVEPLNDATARLFADALSNPCFILDRRTIVVHRNTTAARQFPNATINSPIAFSMRYPALLGAVDTARQVGIAQTVELHQTVPSETWHKVEIAPLGDMDLLVVTLHSLTDAKRAEAMRGDFIANVSHELRTPLTSLIGFIDTLLGPAARDGAAREKFLGIMRQQAERMSRLIDDLLSLSRIEMRQHVRPTATVDLGLILREVREGLQTQADEAGVAVTVAVPDLAVAVTGDREELYEVFENLLDNAIKYGRRGGKVDIALAPTSERQGFDFAITVSDDGPGIEPEHVPRLTERFYRVDADTSRKKKGTGLGLAIVKHIVQRHHGELSIRSKPGEGTRVEVLLKR